MSKDDEKQAPEPNCRDAKPFESFQELGASEDREERERRIASLHGHEQELAIESARFADLCQYFATRNMDVPPHILDQLSGIPRLPLGDRIRRFKALNQSLMEYLSNAGEDTGIRQ
jgi:hypothetical protein